MIHAWISTWSKERESLGRCSSTPLMSQEQAKLSVEVGSPDYSVGAIAKVSAGDDISEDESDLKELLANMTRNVRDQIIEHEQQIIAMVRALERSTS